ncbi:MAG: MBL fold metallo-hydrolase [Solirubrobacteraceae bacterium]
MKPRAIDLHHLGRERVICAWLVGDVIVDPGPTSCLEALLDGLDGLVPRALALTHIHLDHAGASGSLVQRFPGLEVWVHERGARHLVDPVRLVASAARLYGDRMAVLWGEMLPVPEANIHVLGDGERIGDFDVIHTPGHASHHVAFRHGTSAFVGDLAGVRIPPCDFLLPPTPPPDIDVPAWHGSLARVRAWEPQHLALTHFGGWNDAAGHLDRMDAQLDRWAAVARSEDAAGFAAAQRQAIAQEGGAEVAEQFAQAAPPDHGYDGLKRYWSREG